MVVEPDRKYTKKTSSTSVYSLLFLGRMPKIDAKTRRHRAEQGCKVCNRTNWPSFETSVLQLIQIDYSIIQLEAYKQLYFNWETPA